MTEPNEGPKAPYPGVDAFQKKDSKYRNVYRASTERMLQLHILDTYKGFYPERAPYKGFIEGHDTTATEFLRDLAHDLPDDPRYLASKLHWTSLEYLFASAGFHFQRNRLAYEYRFYCASALTAVDALIEYCDRSSQVPYVFIVTTQLPNEYFRDPAPSVTSRDDFGWARDEYRKRFADKISQLKREDRSLIVERHTLVADDLVPDDDDMVRYLSRKSRWEETRIGLTERDAETQKKAHAEFVRWRNAEFVRWLDETHHWHVKGESLSAASTAYVNKIRKDQLPPNVLPKDEDMCIDLIVFGAAEANATDLATCWKFGIGVFGAVRPENIQGLFVKLFSGEELHNNHKRFPLLGYELPSFVSLIEALRGKQTIDDPRSIQLEKSELFVDTDPWSKWGVETTRSKVNEKQTKFKTFRYPYIREALQELPPAEEVPPTRELPRAAELPSTRREVRSGLLRGISKYLKAKWGDLLWGVLFALLAPFFLEKVVALAEFPFWKQVGIVIGAMIGVFVAVVGLFVIIRGLFQWIRGRNQ
jgi:hypothetical protein